MVSLRDWPRNSSEGSHTCLGASNCVSHLPGGWSWSTWPSLRLLDPSVIPLTEPSFTDDHQPSDYLASGDNRTLSLTGGRLTDGVQLRSAYINCDDSSLETWHTRTVRSGLSTRHEETELQHSLSASEWLWYEHTNNYRHSSGHTHSLPGGVYFAKQTHWT